MEIEICTTKVKLSKSIINQMSQASPNMLTRCKVLGYVVNVVKDSSKSLIIYLDKRYYTFPCNWQKGNLSIYRRIGKWTTSRDFSTVEECDEFWTTYQSIIKSAEQIYI